MMRMTMMKTLTGASQYSVCTPEQPHPKARCTENIAPAILHSQLPSNFGQSWKKKWKHFSGEIRKFCGKNCIWLCRVFHWKNNCNEIWKIHKIIWKFGYLSKNLIKIWKFGQKCEIISRFCLPPWRPRCPPPCRPPQCHLDTLCSETMTERSYGRTDGGRC